MAAYYPSGTNTFVPSFDASGSLTVAFSRNPKDFALNRYITITPVKKSSGFYLRITPEVAARVINSDKLREFVWHDGDDAPSGNWATESFEWKQFATERYAFPFQLGYKANEQADFKILTAHAEFAAQDAMTARTLKVLTAILDTGTNGAGTDTATTIAGGYLSAGTPTNPIIKKAFNYIGKLIQKNTLGAVKPSQIQHVISPDLADEMGRSQEVHAYLKESPYALAQVRGDSESQNGVWGLPDTLYGYPIVVEDAVRVSTKKGATTTRGYVLGGTSMISVARPGKLVSAAGGPSFSSVHLFAYEEMTVEQRDDQDNRRINGRVVEDNDVRVVSPASTFVTTGCLSS